MPSNPVETRRKVWNGVKGESMVSKERVSELIGMVSKETGGNLWARGIIWDVGG